MGKKLVSLALALTLALTLVPAALAAGQFTDVADTSPYAASIAWAVEKQITNGTTPTTFGPGNTCTTSHILTFLWRANGRPGDEGDEKAAVISWANSLDIDASDLNAPCTRANAVTYMWKAAGSPAPAETASFTDVAADAPYASAVSWAVEQGVTKGASDAAFAPYDTCTRGQIVTFLCRQLDPEAAKAQPAAQPETPAQPAAQANTPEAALAAVQGVWHRVYGEDKSTIEEYRIDGNTVYLTMLNRKLTGPEYQYADVPIQLVKSETEENCYLLSIQGSTRPTAHQCSAEIGAIDYDGRWNISSPYTTDLGRVVKDSASGTWVVQNRVKQTMTQVGASLRDEEFEAVLKQAKERTEAVSQYPTLGEFPLVPDFGAIYNVSMYQNPVFENPDWHDSFVFFEYDAKSADARAEALFGSKATVFDMFDDYAGILKACGFTEKSAKSISGDPLTVYEKDGYTVQLLNPSFNHQTHGYWQSPAYTVTIYFPKR